MLISYPVTYLTDRMIKANERSALRKERADEHVESLLSEEMAIFQADDFRNRAFGKENQSGPFWTR